MTFLIFGIFAFAETDWGRLCHIKYQLRWPISECCSEIYHNKKHKRIEKTCQTRLKTNLYLGYTKDDIEIGNMVQNYILLKADKDM